MSSVVPCVRERPKLGSSVDLASGKSLVQASWSERDALRSDNSDKKLKRIAR